MLWIFATVVLPAVAGAVFSQLSIPAFILTLVLGLISVGLLMGSSLKLDPKTGWKLHLLILGGTGLMVVTLFSGCNCLINPLH